MSDDLILAEVERVDAALQKLSADPGALLSAAWADVAWLIVAVKAERDEVLGRRADQSPILAAAEDRAREAEAKLREMEQINAVNSAERDRLAAENAASAEAITTWQERHDRLAAEVERLNQMRGAYEEAADLREAREDALAVAEEECTELRAEVARLEAEAGAMREALKRLKT